MQHMSTRRVPVGGTPSGLSLQLQQSTGIVKLKRRWFCDRPPFKQSLDALLKLFKLTAARAADQAGASRMQDEDMQLAISDAFLAAAKVLSAAEEPVR